MTLLTNIDKYKVRQAFAQSATTYDDFAYLQRTVAAELLRRSGLPKLHGKVVDLGCGTGYLTQLLSELGGFSHLWGLDIAPAMLSMAIKRELASVSYLCADLEQLPIQSNSIDWLFSSLALQWCLDLPATLREYQRVLRPGGQLCFATFGEATLQELKQAWRAVDRAPHVNAFYAEADLLELLRTGGWQNITLSKQDYQCQYGSVHSLLRELKGLGAQHVLQGRQSQLMGKARWKTMLDAYPKLDETGKIIATYEVIWVQATVVK
jgi:malonyl-CoA O-methyltransferase